ncbi:MAG: DUF2330 domain-containing protein [Proteobacteria bacterium]|nr:DUF2330 domain-containing protein [Pseudomonadota bacterium]
MLALLLFTALANACGCFASSSAPVDQIGERVLFREDGDKDWTAFIEVQFGCSQPNQDFAWLIPVQKGFDVHSDVKTAPAGLFDDLEHATAPRLTTNPDELVDFASCNALSDDLVAATDLNPLDAASVFLQGQAVVGPYAIEKLDGDTDALLGWLEDAGYTLPERAEEPIQHYIDGGFEFIGVKLNPSELSGPVDTLVLDCGMTEPTVPLKLTAPAAAPDMPITVYVLGSERVSPSAPWTEVEPDVRGISDGAGWEAAMHAAQELAGGRAWTVEYAAPAYELLPNLELTTAMELGHGGYLTRMRSFVDPEEMDIDPVFVNDPDAPNVGVYKRGLGLDRAGTPWPATLAALLMVLVGGVMRRKL